MQTQSEAVQNAYRWALSVTGNRKSGVMQLYCAKYVQEAVENHERYEDAYRAILELLRDWRKMSRGKSKSECPTLKVCDLLDGMLKAGDGQAITTVETA